MNRNIVDFVTVDYSEFKSEYTRIYLWSNKIKPPTTTNLYRKRSSDHLKKQSLLQPFIFILLFWLYVKKGKQSQKWIAARTFQTFHRSPWNYGNPLIFFWASETRVINGVHSTAPAIFLHILDARPIYTHAVPIVIWARNSRRGLNKLFNRKGKHKSWVLGSIWVCRHRLMEMECRKGYYGVLGVSFCSSDDEIRRAYRRLAMVCCY